MHENQWQAAIEELLADGLEKPQVPGNFPRDRVLLEQATTFWNLSAGEESGQGRWGQGPTPDGLGEFQYLADPKPLSTDSGQAPHPDPRLLGTPKEPVPPMATGPNPRS